MNITAAQIKKIREETGAGMMRVKKVLEDVEGSEPKAIEILKKEIGEKMEERTQRTTSEGLLKTYIHHNGKLVAVVELLCETDFVAKNDLFQSLASDLAMQVASMGATTSNELLEQDFIKDPSRKVQDLVKDVVGKTGENISVGRVFRVELGK